MQIQDLSRTDVIHCKTLQEARALLKIFDSLGLTWTYAKSYLTETKWESYKENTCYCPKSGTYSSLKYFTDNGYTVYQASDFVFPITKKTVYKIFGREFEDINDAEEFREKVMKFYGAGSPEEIANML